MAAPRIRTRADYREFLSLDLKAHGLKRWRLHYFLTHPELYYQRLLRRAEYASTRRGVGRLGYVIARFRLARYSLKTGISIPPGVFGAGLSIAHYGSIVVNDHARVGEFCRIHSATNIGLFGGGAPTLGDFVYVGPGAVLYGPITVGSGVSVGANSVVHRDVADYSTVVGVGKILDARSSASVMPQWISSLMPCSPRGD